MKRSSEALHSLKIRDRVGAIYTAFISDKLNFTSWIEVLWRLGLQDDLETHLGDISAMTQDGNTGTPSRSKTDFSNAISLLKAVLEEQQYLISSWSKVLKVNPEEIWEPSIPAFQMAHRPSPLYSMSNEASILTIGQSDDTIQKTIVVQSQISTCGQKLGVIKIQKPE
jgi:hypothetical protein